MLLGLVWSTIGQVFLGVIKIPTIYFWSASRGEEDSASLPIHGGAQVYGRLHSLHSPRSNNYPQIHWFPAYTGWRANPESEHWRWSPSLTDCVEGPIRTLSLQIKGPQREHWELRVFISFAGFYYFSYTAVVVIYFPMYTFCNNKWPLNNLKSLLSVSWLICNTGS